MRKSPKRPFRAFWKWTSIRIWLEALFFYNADSDQFQGTDCVVLISVVCRCCHFSFCICRCCWRGQAYCSEDCRLSARRASHRKAQRRYRQSEKGKRAHRLAENRRRHGQKPPDQKNMDDQASTQAISGCKVAAKFGKWACDRHHICHFCGAIGIIVKNFPRRGYGRRHDNAVFQYG